jgi:hypothetical protein
MCFAVIHNLDTTTNAQAKLKFDLQPDATMSIGVRRMPLALPVSEPVSQLPTFLLVSNAHFTAMQGAGGATVFADVQWNLW